jgi:cytochrome c oxidase subunit II
MWQNLPLFPEQASTLAPRVDALFFFLVAISVFFATLIFTLLLYFAVKYRRRSDEERPRPIEGSVLLELVWTAVPLGLTMVMFAWGALLFAEIRTPPANALEIHVIGKQWMWKIQHPSGHREINELHIPVGRPIKLVMTSEDVIHSFFVPAFRVKNDVLPGRYTTLWFEATEPGEYRLFCAEYCGTQHSGMMGRVIALKLPEYEEWLGGGAVEGSMAEIGEDLFHRFACAGCHRSGAPVPAPALAGLLGRRVALEGGGRVTAEEDYVRESILDPRAKIVAGYQPVMPTFKGLISEEGILQIIAYIKSLDGERKAAERP